MTDPKRWIDDGASDEMREILIAASSEQPEKHAAERALVALGISGAPATGLAAAKGAASTTAIAKAASGPIALALKWGLVGATSAIATVGAVAVLRQSPAPSSAGTPAHLDVPPATGAVTAPAEAQVTLKEALPPSAATEDVEHDGARRDLRQRKQALTPSAAPRSEPASVMMEEVAQIDLARRAVARGDGPGAIVALDAYAARFEIRHFEPEALYLRMEALGHSGDLEGQRRVAERLLASFPSAPQSARARAVLEH